MIKILVPVDFSISSRKALLFALQLKKTTDVSISTLHIAETVVKPGAKLVHKMQELVKEEDRQLINQKMKDFLSGMGEVDLSEPMIRYGDVAKQIINVSIQEGFDMLVIGTRGASKLKEKFIGSNTYSTLRMSVLPTIVVPQTYEIKENKRACIALKFDKLYTQTCANLIETTKMLGYKPEILTVVEGKHKSIQIDFTYINENFPLKIYDDAKPIEVISNHIRSDEYGLLALHFNVYSFFKAITTPLVSKEFTFRSPIPILFLR